MRLLVTGASGYLGHALCSKLARDHHVVGTYLAHPVQVAEAEARPMDLQNPQAVEELLLASRPDCIIHTAAMTQTSDCERQPELAHAVNVGGTEALLAAAAKLPTLPYLVHVSTDLVFDGTRGNYSEGDEPNPLMVYGRTKLEAERAVERYPGGKAIVRSALIYGEPQPHARCFLDWMLEGIREARGALFEDEFRTPIYAADLVWVIESLLTEQHEGIFHVGGPECISRFAFGRLAAEAFGLPLENVRAGRLSDAQLAAPRPQDVSLNTDRAQRVLSFEPFPYRAALARIAAVGKGID